MFYQKIVDAFKLSKGDSVWISSELIKLALASKNYISKKNITKLVFKLSNEDKMCCPCCFFMLVKMLECMWHLREERGGDPNPSHCLIHIILFSHYLIFTLSYFHTILFSHYLIFTLSYLLNNIIILFPDLKKT